MKESFLLIDLVSLTKHAVLETSVEDLIDITLESPAITLESPAFSGLFSLISLLRNN